MADEKGDDGHRPALSQNLVDVLGTLLRRMASHLEATRRLRSQQRLGGTNDGLESVGVRDLVLVAAPGEPNGQCRRASKIQGLDW